MIVANGMPKSGTHALMAMFTVLGLERLPGHLTAQHPQSSLRIRTTPHTPDIPWKNFSEALREPHSKFIHAHVRGSQKHAILLRKAKVFIIIRDPRNLLTSRIRWDRLPMDAKSVEKYMKDYQGTTFVTAYRQYASWRDFGALLLRYEDIPRNFGELPSDNSRTKNKVASDWRNMWTPDMLKVFEDYGGNSLLGQGRYE